MLIVSFGVYCVFLYCLVYLLECVNGLGTDYRGTKAKTKSGKECQRWLAKVPHRPKYVYTSLLLCRFTYYIIFFYNFSYISFLCVCCSITPQSHPLADLESNFCRNPDSDSGGPWCYTTDPTTRWEHCQVPSCTGKVHFNLCFYYLVLCVSMCGHGTNTNYSCHKSLFLSFTDYQLCQDVGQSVQDSRFKLMCYVYFL